MASNVSLLLKVAELYYVEGMNQNEIAKIIGVSRPSISRLLEEAREEGIVKISIEAPFQKNNGLALELRKKFELKEIIVVKDLEEYKYNMENIGKAAADYLEGIIHDTVILGISWGKAVEVLVDHFAQSQLKNSLAIQLNGSLGSEGSGKDGNELVYELGQKLGGKYEFFNAPAYVDSKELQVALFRQPQIEEIVKLGRKMTIAYGGIGNLAVEHNTLVAAGILDNEDLVTLRGEGAVGTMMGRAFDLAGNEVLYKNRFPVSGELDILRNTPISIGAVASKERAKAVLGAIRGHLINVLICDEELARELLTL